MYMIVEVPYEKSDIANRMFCKNVNIHEPEAGRTISEVKVVGLSMDYPGEEVD